MLKNPKVFPVFTVSVHLSTDYRGLVIERLENRMGGHVVTLNSEMTIQAEKNPTLANIIQNAELVIPDGAGVVLYLQYLLGKKIQLHVGMILKSVSPFTIHSDYVKDDLHPDLAILIPLNLTALETHTVVFNEECFDDFSLYLSRTDQLEINAKSLHKTLCSHETEHRLERVSTQGIYKWVPGSVIYWNRKLLHCSDNYIDRDINEKRALVLFTNNDNIE
jgi:hypothetical protein